MGLETTTLELGDINITVSEASVTMGTRRGMMRGDALRLDIDNEAPEVWLLRVITFPDLIAATMDVVGMQWPLSFEAFCDLPERIVNEWSDAVYRLTPHWRPVTADEEKNG